MPVFQDRQPFPSFVRSHVASSPFFWGWIWRHIVAVCSAIKIHWNVSSPGEKKFSNGRIKKLLTYTDGFFFPPITSILTSTETLTDHVSSTSYSVNQPCTAILISRLQSSPWQWSLGWLERSWDIRCLLTSADTESWSGLCCTKPNKGHFTCCLD